MYKMHTYSKGFGGNLDLHDLVPGDKQKSSSGLKHRNKHNNQCVTMFFLFTSIGSAAARMMLGATVLARPHLVKLQLIF